MFQSDDFDEDFFNDILPNNTRNDNNEFIFNPVVKICPEEVQNKPFEFAAPSTSRTTRNVLNIISKRTNLLPSRKSPDRRKVVQRKFPGPAGLLSGNKIDINLQNLDCETSINKTIIPEEIICSQISVNCFKESPWVDMLRDYYLDNENWYLPEKYSISWAKTKAMSKQLLGQKTPFLAAIIKSIDYTIKNPMVVLKDPSGEMAGTIHHEVWDEHSEKLCVGSVIVLCQVGVLTTLKKYYLNITSNNILTIYHYSDFSSQNTLNSTQRTNLEVFKMNNKTARDIKNSLDDFRLNSLREKDSSFDEKSDNPFFKQNFTNTPLFSMSSTSNQNFSFRNTNQGNIQKENNYNFQNNLSYSKQNAFKPPKTVPDSFVSTNFVSSSEKEISFKEILRKTREQNNYTENVPNSYVSNTNHSTEPNFHDLVKKRKVDITNNFNITNSCQIISGTQEVVSHVKRLENRNHILPQNPPRFKFSPKNVNNDFFTSTQNSVNLKSVFCNDDDSILEGLEESFLEDF